MMPASLMVSLERYVKEHCSTSGFLRAVLENDLREACFKADDFNAPNIIDIVRWCHNTLPNHCWGSKEKVKEWLK